jgi:GT2 family glycosyltransferase
MAPGGVSHKTSMNPFLSVVMPTYNGERFIAAAIESVCGQYDEGIELVIVDDGSTDRTVEIVEGFAKVLPIRLITPGRIGNWAAVSNLGLREASGEWACFLHQDDLWLPNRIAALRPAMESADGSLALHNAIFVGPDGLNASGHGLGRWTCPFLEGTVPSDRFVERLLVQNFVAMPSPVFRRSVAIRSGGLDEALWFSADWDLWLRLGAMGPIRFVSQTLSAFRIHPASQTMARTLMPNEWERQLTTVLDRHLETWPVTGKRRASVERVARASIAVNSGLSAASRGEPAKPFAVILAVLALGPGGWHRYLRDSRIVERVGSRLRLRKQAMI